MVKESKGLGASAADATDRVGGLRPEPAAQSQPSGRSPTGATPGPWTYDGYESVGYGGGQSISLPDGSGFWVNTTAANARLIAAAPDLYKALDALRNHCSGTIRPSTLLALLANADLAIAKAEGRS